MCGRQWGGRVSRPYWMLGWPWGSLRPRWRAKLNGEAAGGSGVGVPAGSIFSRGSSSAPRLHVRARPPAGRVTQLLSLPCR